MGCNFSKICPWFFNRLDNSSIENIQDAELQHYEMLHDKEDTTMEISDNSHFLFATNSKVEALTDLKINVSNLVIERKCDPSEMYEFMSTVGSGSFGQVFKVKQKITGEQRAMKKILKTHIAHGYDFNDIEREINILKSLDHPNILKIFEFFQDDCHYYILTELCELGDLQNKLDKEQRFNENTVRILMKQILSSVAYLHGKNVIHGDLKLENILIELSYYKHFKQNLNNLADSLLTDKNSVDNLIKKESEPHLRENLEVKIIDFGCSKIFSRRKMSGIIGTSIYCSPEVIRNEYNEKCDIWACGVIMYYLLTGYPPFDGDTEEEVFSLILKGVPDFSDDCFNIISEPAKDLIKKLMTYDYETRCSAKSAMTHPFLLFEDSQTIDMIELNNDFTILNSLKSVKTEKKFHQAVVAYISHNFAKKEEVAVLKKLFKFLDKNGDGTISKSELLLGYKAFGEDISESLVTKIVEAIDNDNNGQIEYEEFLRSLLSKENLLTETNLKMAFDLFDSDCSGAISVDEIKSLIFGNKDSSEEVVNEFLAQINKKAEDLITFEEFKVLMLS